MRSKFGCKKHISPKAAGMMVDYLSILGMAISVGMLLLFFLIY